MALTIHRINNLIAFLKATGHREPVVVNVFVPSADLEAEIIKLAERDPRIRALPPSRRVVVNVRPFGQNDLSAQVIFAVDETEEIPA